MLFLLLTIVNAGLLKPDQGLLGSAVDEHGCRGSAGFVWCEALNRCHQPFVERCETKQYPQVVLGSARDTHGCVTGGGYSWCETTQECHRLWEKACPEKAVIVKAAKEVQFIPQQLSAQTTFKKILKEAVVKKAAKEVQFVPQQLPAKTVQFIPQKKSTEVKFIPQRKSKEVEFIPQKKSKEVEFIPQKKSKEVEFIPQRKSKEVQFIPQKKPAKEVTFIAPKKSIETQFVYKPTPLKSEQVDLIPQLPLMPMKVYTMPDEKVEAKIVPAPQKKEDLKEEKKYVPVEPVTNNVNVPVPEKEPKKEKQGFFTTVWSAIGRFFGWW